MTNCDILIIGAGAAGLMAARQLTQAGKKVMVLEARNRCGGRIHTVDGKELGAEFIHGNLPLTLGLLKEAGIGFGTSGGEMWQYRNGVFDDEEGFTDGWDVLMEKLAVLESDTSINAFLEKEFPGEAHNALKASVRRFVAGYDNADPDKASAFALRDEWGGDEDHNQYRIEGGYGKMIAFLAGEVEKNGGQIVLNTVVRQIAWKTGKVDVVTEDGKTFGGNKVLVALPLGILQAEGLVSFNPPAPAYVQAVHQIGFGAVIKILLEFEAPFWEDEQTTALAGKSLKNMGFLLSDEEITAWWTQVPRRSSVLTGWLGGPPAALKKELTNEQIMQLSLTSISDIFKRSIDELKAGLVFCHVVNWTTDPFALGSYAYDVVGSLDARKILNAPIENTLFFAGEYLYGGPAMGTVEAALTSGKEVAGKMLR